MMDPSEVEFLSENQHVKILPNFRNCHMFLIGGDYGPFEAGVPRDVPLWMAIFLKQRKKCLIVPPDWMSIDQLEEKKEVEKACEYFTEMPCKNYLEVASLLIKSAQDDIPDVDEVQTLIKDIWEIRMAKLRKSISIMVQEKETHARLDNLTLMEINSIREFLTSSLDHMHSLRCHIAENPKTGTD